jgi:hypothetical protein
VRAGDTNRLATQRPIRSRADLIASEAWLVLGKGNLGDKIICVRVAGRGGRKRVETVRTWGSTTTAILALREHLINEQVTLVVMEATGDTPDGAAIVQP